MTVFSALRANTHHLLGRFRAGHASRAVLANIQLSAAMMRSRTAKLVGLASTLVLREATQNPNVLCVVWASIRVSLEQVHQKLAFRVWLESLCASRAANLWTIVLTVRGGNIRRPRAPARRRLA